jgi:hypothetical protein
MMVAWEKILIDVNTGQDAEASWEDLQMLLSKDARWTDLIS